MCYSALILARLWKLIIEIISEQPTTWHCAKHLEIYFSQLVEQLYR